MVGNHSSSVNAEECLTARHTSRAGTKVGISDPAVQENEAAEQAGCMIGKFGMLTIWVC